MVAHGIWEVNDGASEGRCDRNSGKVGFRSVRIRQDKLPGLADEILQQRKPPANETSASEEGSTWIEWDTEGWHYSGADFHGSEEERRERVALYLLALDAINFCFWPLPEDDPSNDSNTTGRNNLLEYDHLAMALKKMAEADHVCNKDASESPGEYTFSAENLAKMTPEKMIQLFEPCLDPQKYPLPNVEKRAQLWKEVGEGVLKNFNGSALEFLEHARGDATRLVELVAVSFTGFRDEVYTRTTSQEPQRVVFLKRAQIFVGDINAALDLKLQGMERLTTFADYRVPQILRHWGVLEYSDGLASKVDNQIELYSGSFDEISIRAATVVAVEELVKELNKKQKECKEFGRTRFTDVTVDWYLWQMGERMHQEGKMMPFHKVRTHYY